MQPWYAKNARALLEARQNGMKPEGWVTVAMAGGQFAAPTLYVHDDMPADRLDWRMLAGLQVLIETGPTVPVDRIERVARDIAKAKPADLRLRFTTQAGACHELDLGSGIHVPALMGLPAIHTFQWRPITLSGSPVEYRLKAALRRHQPDGWL